MGGERERRRARSEYSERGEERRRLTCRIPQASWDCSGFSKKADSKPLLCRRSTRIEGRTGRTG